MHGSVEVDEEIRIESGIPAERMQEEQEEKMTEFNEQEDSLGKFENGFEGNEELIENKNSKSEGTGNDVKCLEKSEEKNIVCQDRVQYSVM